MRRPLGRGFPALPTAPRRPLAAPFAAAFGVLVAVEVLFLGWLQWDVDPGVDAFLVVPVLLAVWALAGAHCVFWGWRRGWQVLAGAAGVALLAMLGFAVLFGLLGGGSAFWSAVLLMAGPIGCLTLTLQRPVRRWTTRRGSMDTTAIWHRGAR